MRSTLPACLLPAQTLVRGTVPRESPDPAQSLPAIWREDAVVEAETRMLRSLGVSVWEAYFDNAASVDHLWSDTARLALSSAIMPSANQVPQTSDEKRPASLRAA